MRSQAEWLPHQDKRQVRKAARQARRLGLPPRAQAPPLQETLQAGVRDFNAGRYQVAAGEFQDVVHYYPLDDLAGTAQFYLGEIAYQQQDYPDAIGFYNQVLDAFSGNAKAPAAQLHKGLALLATNKRDAGIHELRLLIQRHPQTPEARVARSKLNGMGVKITAATAASALEKPQDMAASALEMKLCGQLWLGAASCIGSLRRRRGFRSEALAAATLLWWRTSAPCTQKMTSSAMLVA